METPSGGMKIRTPLAGTLFVGSHEGGRKVAVVPTASQSAIRRRTLVHFQALSRAIWQRSAGYADYIGRIDCCRATRCEESYGDR